MLKQEIARPTTKNWVHRASNWPSLANFNQHLAKFCMQTCTYCTKSLTAMPKRIVIVSCIETTTHPRCITKDKIVKHTAPIVAQRVPIFPGHVARAAHAVLEAKPVKDNDKEEVEELQPPCIVSFLIDKEYELVNEPALLHQGPAPAGAAKQQTSIEFDGTKQEGVNPELTRLYCMWQLEEGLPRFVANLAVNAYFSPLICLKRLRTPLLPLLVADKPFSRPCCCAFPMLCRPAPVKPISQGHQAGQGANQPSCCQHHQHQPWADCRNHVHPPLSNAIAQRFTLHFETNSSQVITAVMTIAIYFYLGGVTVALGSAQLAYFHAVILFATFVPWFFDQKWELLSF
jgi:hypothetical protein